MAVFEYGRHLGSRSVPISYSVAASAEQHQALASLQKTAEAHPHELLLVRTADIFLRRGGGDPVPMPSTANLRWEEYLGVIPLENPSDLLISDGRNIEIRPEKFATFEEVRQGRPQLVTSSDPIGHMWHKRIDLGALNSPAQDYVSSHLVERWEVRKDPVLEIHVGHKAVKDYMLSQAAKATERAAGRDNGWWEEEIDADNLLIGFYRLQSALGRVVLPLSPHVEKLMILQGSNPDQRKRFVDDLIGLVEINPKELIPGESATLLKNDIIVRAKAAVLGGLSTDRTNYREPLLPGIEGVNRTVDVDRVIRSICAKYGIKTPPPAN